MNSQRKLGSLSKPDIRDWILLMILGGLLAMVRNLPATLLGKVKSQLFITVTVDGDDPIFDWITTWLSQHEYAQRARNLRAQSSQQSGGGVLVDSYDDLSSPSKKKLRVIFSPDLGTHVLRYGDTLLWVSRSREESTSLETRRVRQSYQIRALSRSRTVLEELIEDARAVSERENVRELIVYSQQGGYWQKLRSRSPRSLESVILPGNSKQQIVADVRRFLESEGWYADRGIPYRRGYLLHGTPGSGKSSLVTALASAFEFPIFWLSLTSDRLDDLTLVQLLNTVHPHAVVLLEDIDAAFTGRESGNSSVSFSGLLNAIDGVVACEGRLLFMTTNHPEKLDPALTRSGRVDYWMEFGQLTAEQASEVAERFFPGTPARTLATFGKWAEKKFGSVAELQEYLLLHRDNKKEAFAGMRSGSR